MTEGQLEEILECLSTNRRVFPYFKGRYALMLLAEVVGSGMTVAEIKATRFRGLLDKDAVRAAMHKASSGLVTSDLLEAECPAATINYRLSLGRWGGSDSRHDLYYQTSRPGKNLVLQMNFSHSHNRHYDRLIQPTLGHPFEFSSHPIATNGDHTLAWARLDIDLDTGEALIEEIQNDWLRIVLWRKKDGERAIARNRFFARILGGTGRYAERFDEYVRTVLKPHFDLWDEAMLAAAIRFLHNEVGVRTIYYHTFDGGNRLKGLKYSQPPQSLYTSLPRRFCFRIVDRGPEFLQRRQPGARRGKRKQRTIDQMPRFHLLEV